MRGAIAVLAAAMATACVDMSAALTKLAAKYHQPDSIQGRTFRVFACGYPAVPSHKGNK